MQTGPGLGARRLNYDTSTAVTPPPCYPSHRLFWFLSGSALLAAAGGPKAAINLKRLSLCAAQPRYTPRPYCTLPTLPSRATVSSMSASMPVHPAALRSMSPCREVRSRSVVVSAPAPPPVPIPSHAAANMRPPPVRPPCPMPVPSHPLLHVHTHTHVDSRPAATATEHPVRGRVKAGRPRGEAVCGRRLRECCTAGNCMPWR
jgi:hypothetical protein